MSKSLIPDLPEEFQAPAGWKTGRFINGTHDIHYGHVSPEGDQPSAIVIVLEGLSEFTEKYFETSRSMLARNFAVWAMDWQYQGRSGRLKDYPQRRHSDGVHADVSDLKYFITNIIEPANITNAPIVILAHSFGAHVTLRFQSEHPGHIKAIAASAPFLGLRYLDHPLIDRYAHFMARTHGLEYAADKDWHEQSRPLTGRIKFSADPRRNSVHRAWCMADPALQVGGPTWAWISEALKSRALLMDPAIARAIDIPLIIGIAGNEEIVRNGATRKFAKNLPYAVTLELKDAYHEIPMEKDFSRNQLFSGLDKILEEHKIVGAPIFQPA